MSVRVVGLVGDWLQLKEDSRMGPKTRSCRTAGGALVVAAGLLLASCSSGSNGVHLQTVDPPSTSPTHLPPATSRATTTGPSPQDTTSPTTSSDTLAPVGSTSPTSGLHPSTDAPGTPPTTTPWPANFTAAQQADAKAALAAFDGFVRVSAAAEKQPGKDWTKEIRKYAADPTAAQTLSALTTLVTAKVHSVVSSTYEQPSVKSANSREVVMQVCVDATKASIADASGKPVKLRPPAHPRTLVTFNVYRYSVNDGGWLVSETVVPNPVKTC